MSDSTTVFQRKFLKLLRDPKLFVTDAIQNRMPKGRAREAAFRPYAVFERDSESLEFSAETLVEAIAQRYPVLHTIHEVDFAFGVLEKHVIGVIQLLARFAESHGHQLTIAAATTNESPLRGVSEQLLGSLRHVSYFTVRLGTLRHTLLCFPIYIYRKKGETLRGRGPLVMTHIPESATRRIWDGGRGQFWPCDLLDADVAPKEPAEDVDIVYTWVDSRDPQWRKLYAEFYGTEVDEDRFSSRDELRYSMRSVHYYCGWARKIYVLTNCAPPDWLDPEHDKIVWVNHSDVLQPENLPTFNCHAIETGMQEIEGLSERYVYFNDDVFVTRPLRRRAFFDSSGRNRVFLETQGKLAPDRNPIEESWYEARLTAQRALLTRLGYAATHIAHHAPHVVLRARAAEMFEDFAEDVQRIAAERVRSPKDLPLLSFLFGHYSIAKGFGVNRPVNSQILDIGNAKSFDLKEKTEFLCINDGQGSAEDGAFVDMAQDFMEQRFPHKAPWER